MLYRPHFEVLSLEQARTFLSSLNDKARTKVIQNIDKARFLTRSSLFKKLTNDIWEFRAEYSGLQYRLLAFWDKKGDTHTLVIVTHGFIKKTNKVALRQVLSAVHLRTKYLSEYGQEK